MNIREGINFLQTLPDPSRWMVKRLATLRGQLIALGIQVKSAERYASLSKPIRAEIMLWERLGH